MLNNYEIMTVNRTCDEHLESGQLPASIIFDHSTTSTFRKTKLLIREFSALEYKKKTSDFHLRFSRRFTLRKYSENLKFSSFWKTNV